MAAPVFALLLLAAPAATADAGTGLPAATLTVDAGAEDITVSLDQQELRFWPSFPREQTLHTTAGTHLVSVKRPTITWSGWVELQPGRNTLPSWKPIEVSGVVLAPDGGTARGATVQIESEQLAWSRHGVLAPRYQRFGRAAECAGGRFTTTVAEPGRYRVSAYDPSLGFAQLDIDVPGKPVRLTLEPGPTLEVHPAAAYSWGVMLNTPGPHWDHTEPIAMARTDGGVAIFPNLRGSFEASEPYFPTAYGVATLDGGSFSWSPADAPVITGTVIGLVRHAVPKSVMVCAWQGGSGTCGEISADGGFSIAVQPEITYDLKLSLQDQWLTEPAHAKGGDQVELHATRFKPVTIPVNDDSGRPILHFTSGGKKLSRAITITNIYGARLEAPGFVTRSVHVEPQAIPKEIRLARLPLVGSVHDANGAPVAGAAVVLRCAEEPDQLVRLRRYDPDIGLPWWAYWPEGLECIVTHAQTGADGRFSFKQVTDFPGPVVKVEARQGRRSVVVPFEPGTPLDLVLP